MRCSTGAAVDCIPISQIRESRVRSDSVIDFRAGGKKWYRNTLPNSCPSLGFEERFSYRTSLSQLCAVDTIAVLQSYGGQLQDQAIMGLEAKGAVSITYEDVPFALADGPRPRRGPDGAGHADDPDVVEPPGPADVGHLGPGEPEERRGAAGERGDASASLGVQDRGGAVRLSADGRRQRHVLQRPQRRVRG